MIFIEGFDGPGTVAALGTKLTLSNSAQVSLQSALTGSGSSLGGIATPTASSSVTVPTPGMGATLYLSAKFRIVSVSGSSVLNSGKVMDFLSTGNGSPETNAIYDSTGGQLVFRRSATVLGSVAVSVDQTYTLHVYNYIHDSSGRLVVKLNGVQLINFTGDTKNSTVGSPTFSGVLFQTTAYSTGTTRNSLVWDHIVISDTEIPDCRVGPWRPTEDGHYMQFTPSSGSDHHPMVSESVLDTATRNTSSTPGHRDSFKFAEPSFTGNIIGIAAEAYVDKSDSGTRAVRTFVRQGGTDYDGAADLALTQAGNIASQYYEVNPATSAAFTVAELTGASRTEFGIKVQS